MSQHIKQQKWHMSYVVLALLYFITALKCGYCICPKLAFIYKIKHLCLMMMELLCRFKGKNVWIYSRRDS